MVGNEEGFFPSHEYMLALGEITICEIRSFGLFSQGTPGGKSRPVVQVGLFRSAPFFITSLESVFGADNFSFKKCSQCRMILSETCGQSTLVRVQCTSPVCSESQTLDSKVAAEIGLSHVHVLDLNINIINLAIALLCSDELASRAKKGGCVVWQKL